MIPMPESQGAEMRGVQPKGCVTRARPMLRGPFDYSLLPPARARVDAGARAAHQRACVKGRARKCVLVYGERACVVPPVDPR